MPFVIRPDKIRAVIFDLDGVIADTADLHVAAWRRMFDEYLRKRSKGENVPFQPFRDSDYRTYVDGKPRYDGVEDFLASRRISIPHGSRQDSPDEETVCGLGNRKNNYYLHLLDKRGPRLYQSSVDFIHAIRARGLRTAIISSSQNCAQILRMTGTQDLFDVKVDGIDLDTLHIPGKPDPAVFLEAAKRIDTSPKEAAVVEDALAGVEAGRRGGFGLVVGVARSRNGRKLKERGADVTVTDLKDLKLASEARGRRKTEAPRARTIPSALTSEVDDLVLRSRRLALFLDYDGTLTEIVENPSKASIPEETRDGLRLLSSLCTVAILSGRDVQVVRKLVDLEGIVYVGSHGFDIIMADGKRLENPRWDAFLPSIDRAERELRAAMEGVPGALVERKRFAIAVHYRMVDPASVQEVKEKFDLVASSSPELRRSEGKKVLEVLPNVAWNKGTALLFLLRALKLDGRSRALPIFIGDDLTDEDAFEVVRGRGLGILVTQDAERSTLARRSLRDPEEVRLFLERLIGMLEGKRP
jgi:trehalose-phosphatase